MRDLFPHTQTNTILGVSIMRVSINTMINLIEDFCEDRSADKLDVTIGGCIGTSILNLTITTVSGYYDMSEILVIEGCQDYIEIEKERFFSHVFYGELFTSTYTKRDVHGYEDPLFPNEPRVVHNIITDKLKYSIIIVNESHLIDDYFLNIIRDVYKGKIICIVDPFDIDCEKYAGVPTVVDSMNKLSMLQAYGRKLINVETRFIDTSINSKIRDVGNISYRNIGKFGLDQYVTTDKELLQKINNKYSKIQRLQKVMIVSDDIEHHVDSKGFEHIFMNRSLGIIMSKKLVFNCLYRLKLHNSKECHYFDLSYDGFKHHQTKIVPANILVPELSKYHKYLSTVLVLSKNGASTISPRQLYSIIRNTNNLTIGYWK